MLLFNYYYYDEIKWESQEGWIEVEIGDAIVLCREIFVVSIMSLISSLFLLISLIILLMLLYYNIINLSWISFIDSQSLILSPNNFYSTDNSSNKLAKSNLLLKAKAVSHIIMNSLKLFFLLSLLCHGHGCVMSFSFPLL